MHEYDLYFDLQPIAVNFMLLLDNCDSSLPHHLTQINNKLYAAEILFFTVNKTPNCFTMAKNNSIQKKRFNNANRKKNQRRFHREKVKIDKMISNVLNNTEMSTESNDNNDVESSDIQSSECVFYHELKEWALKYNVRTNCLNDLLKILAGVGIPFLPKDTRTFLHTPKEIQIENIANGQFWYAGITTRLASVFQTADKNVDVELNFHVDGLQLFNSSNKQFWPILAQMHGLCNSKYC